MKILGIETSADDPSTTSPAAMATGQDVLDLMFVLHLNVI